MEIVFWYSSKIGGTGIQTILENIGYCQFKDIDIETPNNNLINFFVFVWETDYEIKPNIDRPTHTQTFFDLIKKLQSLDFYFIGDFSTEAHSNIDKLSESFIEKLIKNDIDINRLILAKNDSSSFDLKKIQYSNHYINSCFFPHFFVNTFLEMKKYVKQNYDCKKEKSFLCLNRRLHKHKFKVLEELNNQNYLEDTFYTAVKSYTNLSTNSFIDFPKQLDGDIMYGEKLSVADEHLYRINPNWYYKSKLNIVTETIFYTNEIHITEKTWKPIYLGIPFVVAASKNHLKNLKEFGFKTFDKFIDESYDNINGDEKIPLIIEQAKNLSKIYNNSDILDIIEYNKKLYYDTQHKKDIIQRFFVDKILKITQKKRVFI